MKRRPITSIADFGLTPEQMKKLSQDASAVVDLMFDDYGTDEKRHKARSKGRDKRDGSESLTE